MDLHSLYQRIIPACIVDGIKELLAAHFSTGVLKLRSAVCARLLHPKYQLALNSDSVYTRATESARPTSKRLHREGAQSPTCPRGAVRGPTHVSARPCAGCGREAKQFRVASLDGVAHRVWLDDVDALREACLKPAVIGRFLSKYNGNRVSSRRQRSKRSEGGA